MANDLINEMIRISEILEGDKILSIDADPSIKNYLKNNGFNAECIHCYENDLRMITSYPEEYMNNFRIVFCPDMIYSLKAKNRNYLIKIIAWAMSPVSRFVFTVPELDLFMAKNNKKLRENGPVISITDDNFYFKVIKKYGILKKETEYWHKSTVHAPFNLFKLWNFENPSCQWDLESVITMKKNNYMIVSIDLKKDLISYKEE
jgi:hypothetical protein